MFKKVLVVEDFDSINLAILQALSELSVVNSDYAKYCDDALLKIKKALFDNEPYDLMISDLSFLDDGRAVTLKSGDELIAAVKKLQPDLKIIILSVEDKSVK